MGPFEAREIQEQENRPEKARLNQAELFKLIEDNPYAEEVRGRIKRGEGMGFIRSVYGDRFRVGQECLRLLQSLSPPYEREVSELLQAHELKERLAQHVLSAEPKELESQLSSLEEVIDWIDGVREIATAEVGQLRPYAGLVLDLEALAKQQNGLAAFVVQRLPQKLENPSDESESVGILAAQVTGYAKEVEASSDALQEMQEVVKVIRRWYPKAFESFRAH